MLAAPIQSNSSSSSRSRWWYSSSTSTYSSSSSARQQQAAPPNYKNHNTATAASSSASQQLRNLVKPFLLKCHPDVVQDQSDEARAINLIAIQNLNMYLDQVSATLKKNTRGGGRPLSGNVPATVTIDFCLLQHGPLGKKKTTTFYSRRQVELRVPPPPFLSASSSADAASEGRMQQSSLLLIKNRATRELIKLLRVAGLSVPVGYDDDSYGRDNDSWDYNDKNSANPFHARTKHRTSTTGSAPSPESIYRENRDRFTAQINWKRLDQAYNAAVADMQADILTSGLVRNHTTRRRRLIAQILSRAECPNLALPDQLVVLRRLSLLLEQHFDALELEDLGACWEQLKLVVYDPEATFNEDDDVQQAASETSSSSSSSSAAPPRRKQQQPQRGFVFALGPDHTVTIRIPLDFTDDQFVRELNRNLWDFVDVLEDEDPDKAIFPATVR